MAIFILFGKHITLLVNYVPAFHHLQRANKVWWCLDQLNSCRRSMKTVVIEILSRQFKYAWISPLPMLDFTEFTEMLLVCFPVLEQY